MDLLAWTKNWTKIKGIYTAMNYICEALKVAVNQCEQSTIGLSFMASNLNDSEKSLNKLEPSFMYTQIL